MSKERTVSLAELPDCWGEDIADAGFSLAVQTRIERWRIRRNRAFLAAATVAASVSAYQFTQLSAGNPVVVASESLFSPLSALTTPTMLLALLVAGAACSVACVIPGRV